jgi:hypothetical protein
MSNDAAMATSSEEISPQDAWQMLQEDPRAQLVDVRTEPEWICVGMPALGTAEEPVLQVSWQNLP